MALDIEGLFLAPLGTLKIEQSVQQDKGHYDRKPARECGRRSIIWETEYIGLNDTSASSQSEWQNLARQEKPSQAMSAVRQDCGKP